MTEQHPASTSDADKRARERASLPPRDAPAWTADGPPRHQVDADRGVRLADQRARIRDLEAEVIALTERYQNMAHAIGRTLTARHVPNHHDECVTCSDADGNPEPFPCPTATDLRGVMQ